MDYKCKNCGSTTVYIKRHNKRMGVYCSDCNSFITWTSYKKMMEVYRTMKSEDIPDNMALRNVYKRNNITTIKCSKCGCLLCNTLYGRPQGQFDLVNAKYCPNCGRELI